MPLPCSNLPLDHSGQGHRVHYTDRSEGGRDKGPLKRLEKFSDLGEKCALSHTQNRTGHMWKCGAFAIPKSLMLTGPNQQKHRRMLFQHTLARLHPHLSHPPQWKGRNRFLPCGVSELLRQTEQELTTGRGLHAHNAQMGPWTLRHLLCSYIHIPRNTMSESISIGTRFKMAPHFICDTYFCKHDCPLNGQ